MEQFNYNDYVKNNPLLKEAVKSIISVYQMKQPLEVELEDDMDVIKKLKKGDMVNVVEYDQDNGLAFLNIGGKVYTTYDLLDTAKHVKGRKLKYSE